MPSTQRGPSAVPVHSVDAGSGSSPQPTTWHLHWVLNIHQGYSGVCLHGSQTLCCLLHHRLQAVQYLTLCQKIQEAAKRLRAPRVLLVALVL